MSFFIKRKLKDGRQIRGRYSHRTNKVCISQADFDGLVDELDVAYEQAKQLQTIIENLQDIKAEAVRKTLGKISTEIEKVFCISVVTNELRTPMEVKTEILQIINKHMVESEDA